MRFVLSGYYGFGNLGDELILEAILKDISFRLPKSQIILLHARPEKFSHPRAKAVSRWNPFRIAHEISKADVVISGGGGLFQDETGFLSPLYYLFIVWLARILSKPVFIWAVGIGPVRNPLLRSLLGRLLRRANVTVRDSLSAERLGVMGVPQRNMRVTADPVFSVARSKIENSRSRNPQLSVVLRSSGASPVALWKALIHLRDSLGWSVTFLLFHPANDFIKLVPQIEARQFSWKPAQIGDGALVKQNLLACERLHGLYLSCLSGIPCVALFPNEKTRGFLQEVALPVIERSHSAPHAIDLFQGLWKNRQRLQKDLARARGSLLARARETGRIFKETVHRVESRPEV